MLTLLALRHAVKSKRPQLAQNLLSNPNFTAEIPSVSWKIAERQHLALQALDICLLPIWQLPLAFQQMEPKAPMLFVRGNPKILQQKSIAIIGSRNSSSSGEAWAYEQAKAAAKRGEVVISGGALGIDTAAHLGALAGKGQTLVFLGVNIDRIYPATNRKLFEKIIANGGALVSEHPPFMPTFKSDHALRNRFIAALGHALLIAEAKEDSGSLVTADWAQRFKVPVFVSPSSIGEERSGLELLLKQKKASTLE